MTTHPFESLIAAGEFTAELRVLDLPQNLGKDRSGRQSHCNQIIAAHKRFRSNLFLIEPGLMLLTELVVLQVAVGRQSIDTCQFQELLDAVFTQKTLERAEAHFRRLNMP